MPMLATVIIYFKHENKIQESLTHDSLTSIPKRELGKIVKEQFANSYKIENC